MLGIRFQSCFLAQYSKSSLTAFIIRSLTSSSVLHSEAINSILSGSTKIKLAKSKNNGFNPVISGDKWHLLVLISFSFSSSKLYKLLIQQYTLLYNQSLNFLY